MTVGRYAIVNGSDVVNIILLDTEAKYTPPTGHLIIPAPEEISIGWKKLGNEWVAPEGSEPTPEPVESPDVITAKYEAVQELINAGISEGAALRIVGLPVEA